MIAIQKQCKSLHHNAPFGLQVIPMIGVWAGYFPLQFNWWFALAFTIYSPCCYMLLYYCHSRHHLRSIYFSIVAAHMFWYAYAKATFNTIIATLAKREIKFKTTEKSVLSANVTDEANKAKVRGKKNASPLRRAWSKVCLHLNLLGHIFAC